VLFLYKFALYVLSLSCKCKHKKTVFELGS